MSQTKAMLKIGPFIAAGSHSFNFHVTWAYEVIALIMLLSCHCKIILLLKWHNDTCNIILAFWCSTKWISVHCSCGLVCLVQIYTVQYYLIAYKSFRMHLSCCSLVFPVKVFTSPHYTCSQFLMRTWPFNSFHYIPPLLFSLAECNKSKCSTIHIPCTFRISLQSSTLQTQPLQMFGLLQATLQQNDCSVVMPIIRQSFKEVDL